MKNSFEPKFNITNRITSCLTRIERARGFLEAAALSEARVREMGRRALILEAHHTTHIEGTRLSLEQAERLLAGKPVPEADPNDVRELLNYRRAFDFVSEYLEIGGPITQGLIVKSTNGWSKVSGEGAQLPASTGKSGTTWPTPSPARLFTRRPRRTMSRS